MSGTVRVTYDNLGPFQGFETAMVVKVEVPCECGGSGKAWAVGEHIGAMEVACPQGGESCDGWKISVDPSDQD